MRLHLLQLIASMFLLAARVLHAGDSPAILGAEVFTNPIVRQISLTISPENLASLRHSPREFVNATLREGTNAFDNVELRLKGATGSFRSIDGKPGFTINFDRKDTNRTFYGLRKIHLNNSVEDPSYMNELIGGEVFRAAGIPAARAAHAIVDLNGKRLGVYVLKEGFTRDFLAQYFRQPKGNLYDTGAGHDVDEPLRKDLGDNPEDRSELDALTNAAAEPDLAKRWIRLQRVLEMDRMLSFMATEILLGHRDGYCLARNNFRVYHNVDTGRLLFFPHGMDVLFGNARAFIEPRMSGLAARAIMETPDGRRAYRARLGIIFTNHFDVPRMHARIDETLRYLAPVLLPQEAANLEREANGLKARIAERRKELARLIEIPPLEVLQFTENSAPIQGWQAFDVPQGGRLEHEQVDGKDALTIVAGPVTSASWRAKVLLPPGRYRFEATARTQAVKPLPFGKNHGAMLRVNGAGFARSKSLLGATPWSILSVPFETSALEQEIDLVCELRASSGSAQFDASGIRLIREK